MLCDTAEKTHPRKISLEPLRHVEPGRVSEKQRYKSHQSASGFGRRFRIVIRMKFEGGILPVFFFGSCRIYWQL
jgi:hypothetical protein